MNLYDLITIFTDFKLFYVLALLVPIRTFIFVYGKSLV